MSGYSKVIRRIVCITMVLVMALLPVLQSNANWNIPSKEDVSIDELLEAGEYAEGEAVALVKTSGDVSLEDVEEISTVSAEAVKDTVEATAQSDINTAKAVANKLSPNNEGYSIKHICDDSKSTREILEELYEDSDVIYAEPNYINKAPEVTEESEIATGEMYSEDLLGAAQTGEMYSEDLLTTTPVGDLTKLQWYLADTEHVYNTPYASESNYMLNVPGWAEGRTNESAPANASGTVCVMDTGIDATHPDLAPSMYHFTPEQQKKFNCGEYGLNAAVNTSKDDTTDTNDYNDHGTHVAGIIGGAWNNMGTSGIANGAKIFAVRIFGNDGKSSYASTELKGFAFLKDVAKEVNLKAINCSWGNTKSRFMINAMSNELGRLGVTTVFASGNDDENRDEILATGAADGSIYNIVVDSATSNGKKSSFSDYGLNSTDIFSAGDGILAHSPRKVTIGNGEFRQVTDYTRFFPEVSSTDSLIYGIDRAYGESAQVRMFDTNPLTNADAKEITAKDDKVGFNDRHSYSVKANTLKKLSSNNKEQGFYMAIPVENANDTSFIGLKESFNGEGIIDFNIETLTYRNSEGKAVEVDHIGDYATSSGYQGAACSNAYSYQWKPLSYNVKGTMESANKLHNMSAEDKKQVEEEFGPFKDPGQLTGLCSWENNGKKYIIVGISVGDISKKEIKESTNIYLDDIALGNANCATGYYQTMSGTSMATPTVAAALAIIAKDEPASSSLSEDELAKEALLRNAKLLASVDYDDENLLSLCRTGGRLNLHNQSTFTKTAPLIDKATSDGSELTIDGYFFGDDIGSVKIDGNPINVNSWRDNQIKVGVKGLTNSRHVVMVTKNSGERMQAIFSHSSDDNEGIKLYEKSLPLPFDSPGYSSASNDLIDGKMASIDGCLYALAQGVNTTAMSLWKYDINADKWSVCAKLPDKIMGTLITSMVGWNGKIYVSANTGVPYQPLESYDPKSDKWEHVALDLTAEPAKMTVCDGKLFYYPGPIGTWADEVKDDGKKLSSLEDKKADSGNSGTPKSIAVIDPEKKTVEKLSGEIPSLYITGSGKYLYAIDRVGGDDSEISGIPGLYRGEYNEATKSVSFRVLPGAANDIFDQSKLEEIVLCGLSEGVVLVGKTKTDTDTYILWDDEDKLTPHDRTSTYNMMAAVAAGSLDDWVYVLAPDTTENEAAYFRASNIKRSKPTPEPGPTPEPTPVPGPTPGEGGDGGAGGNSGSSADKNTNGASSASGETKKVPKVPKTGDKIWL